jgi:endogenous inhibitor of DNA gyrase (YacG/DUF329 family)
MKIGKVALVLLAVGALAQAAYLTYSYMNQKSEDGEDTPATFLCANPACEAEFTKNREEMIEAAKASPDGMPCPTCGKVTTKRSIRCPSCQKAVGLIGHGKVPGKCDKCGKAIAVDDNNVPFCPG